MNGLLKILEKDIWDNAYNRANSTVDELRCEIENIIGMIDRTKNMTRDRIIRENLVEVSERLEELL